MLAVHAFHIAWSQQARSYVLVTLLLIVSTQLFIAATEEGGATKRWIAYVVVTALAAYCHLFSGFVVLAQWLSLRRRDLASIGTKRVLMIGGSLSVLTAPIVAFAAFQNKGQLDWVQPLTTDEFVGFLRTFVGSATATATVSNSVLLVAYALMCAAALTTLLRNWPRFRAHSNLLILWLMLPIAVTAFVSFKKSIFVDRFMLMCLPALLLLAAVGIVGLGDRRFLSKLVSGAVVTAVIALSISEDLNQYRTLLTTKNNWRAMTEEVLKNQQRGDAAIFFTEQAHMSFNYYATLVNGRDNGMTPAITLPDLKGTPTGAQPIPTAEEVRSAITGRARVWLILNNTSIGFIPARGQAVPLIRKTIEEEFTVAREEQMQGQPNFTIVLYERNYPSRRGS
jgi:mannosyltransferase